MCALFTVVRIATLILAVLSTSHMSIVYSVVIVKTAIWSATAITTMVLMVAVTASLLCYSGSVAACGLKQELLAAARTSIAIARLGCACSAGSLGPWVLGGSVERSPLP